MKVVLSKHAKQRMSERKIQTKKIIETIDLPDYTITKNKKIEAFKKLDNQTLKVVYIKEHKFIKIITVILK